MSSTQETIVLCAGPATARQMPAGARQTTAMIPVNGKPVIGWILDDLLAKGTQAATVVLRADDSRLEHFLQWAYSGRLDLRLAPLSDAGTILHSVRAGLNEGSGRQPVRIVLGDTLIRDPFDYPEDYVYVGAVTDSRRWCLAIIDEQQRVVDYLDKQEGVLETRTALAGFYRFQDGGTLRACLAQALAAGERELSHVLRRYGEIHSITARPAQEWYDFGHIDNLVHARRRLLQPRYFNSLTINPMLNTITKVSDQSDKLQNELDWFQQIPDELKVLTPRIVSHREENGRLQIVQEYYGYPSLAELYVYGDLHVDTWVSILRHVMRVHQEFCRYKGHLDAEAIAGMYAHKTWQRLEMLCDQAPSWRSLLAGEMITYNGRTLRSVASLRREINARARRLVETAEVTVIHGDLCFSNTLFDVNHQIIRLIDPRGSFGVKGIYGDSRYDVAKLRHSVAGLYDFIVADLFRLEEGPAGYAAEVYANGLHRQVATAFDQMITQAGYDLSDIRFTEGLLFLSMLPLHADHPRRQLMFFLRGLELLNDEIASIE